MTKKVTKKIHNIAILDDHEIIREGITSFLPDRYHVVLSSNSLNSLTCFDKPVDIVILDLNLDKLPGSELIKKVLSSYPKVKVVIFSMRDSIESVFSCYDAQASAFISKGKSLDHLITALDSVSEGKLYIDPDISEELTEYQFRGKLTNPGDILTRKEYKVFLLKAQGKTSKEVADLTESNVKNIYNIVSIIQKKLEIPTEHFKDLAVRCGLLIE